MAVNRKDEARRYCSLYVIRYTLGSAAIAALMILTMWKISSDLGVSMLSVSGGSSSILLKWFITVIPTGILSYAVGWFAQGTRGRFLSRISLNVVLACLLLYAGFSTSYRAATVGSGGLVEFTDMALYLDALPLTILLLFIPLSSVIDAILEYRQIRSVHTADGSSDAPGDCRSDDDAP